jgi:ABC-2 type transport system permease protein
VNPVMIRHLVTKDWEFQRRPIALAMAGGIVSLILLFSNSSGMFYVGSVLLITVVISIGIYLAFLTVISERTEGMLPFIMSLPIGVREYTAAKLAANLGLFVIPWLAAIGAAIAVVLTRDAVPDGLLPYALLLLLHLATGYVLTLATALATGSPGWTIAVGGGANLFLQFFMYWTSHLTDVAATIDGPVVVWVSSIRWLILAEVLAIAVTLWVTWIWQSRRTDFT